MIGVDWGGLQSLAEWGWSKCNEGGIVLKSGDLALGTDCDRSALWVCAPVFVLENRVLLELCDVCLLIGLLFVFIASKSNGIVY